jgi:hypothetical protein
MIAARKRHLHRSILASPLLIPCSQEVPPATAGPHRFGSRICGIKPMQKKGAKKGGKKRRAGGFSPSALPVAFP